MDGARAGYGGVLLLTVTATAMGLMLVACGSKADAPQAAPPPAVEAVTVGAPGGASELTGSGALQRRREMALSFRIPGVLTRMNVEAGDAVRAGQALAAIDPAGVDARQTQAAADLERARRDADRARKLYATGFVAKARLDDAESALKAAQAAHAGAAFDRRWANLSSPVSGVVLARTAQSGEVVAAGQTVLTVADLSSPLVLRLPLPARDASRVKVGASAAVTTDALPGQTLTGVVTRLGQAADARTGAVTVEIEVQAPPELKSGQIAAARLQAPASQQALARADYVRIPAEALLEASGDKASVLRLDGTTARRTDVRFGGFDGDDALVAGLAAGTRVITAGAGFVSDGEKVAVVDPRALAAPARKVAAK